MRKLWESLKAVWCLATYRMYSYRSTDVIDALSRHQITVYRHAYTSHLNPYRLTSPSFAVVETTSHEHLVRDEIAENPDFEIDWLIANADPRDRAWLQRQLDIARED